ncbi:MAG TPA: hypothetical protein VMT46_08495 [Anaerolineaceae bacterium]|nr:hypothetical protein [Anaerolineaceae bacterium]
MISNSEVGLAPGMAELVAGLVRSHLELWWQGSPDAPRLGRRYSLREKLPRERRLEAFLDSAIADLRSYAAHPQDGQSSQIQQRLLAQGREIGVSVFDLEPRQLDALESFRFGEAAGEFARMARRYDPAISGEDIYQASRNVMTMNILQYLFGLKVEITPSIFAYSMLYPYSDNYLDDPDLFRQDKLAFSQRFASRLINQTVVPANPTEEKIFELVRMVEGQYAREKFPWVYASLLAIHAAQSRSMGLMRRGATPFEADVLGMSFEKGGVSVLADGYLVAGDLTPAQREFAFGYGAFTQLLDDQEDVEMDLSAGLMSLYSQTAQGWPLDRLANLTMSFGRRILAQIDSFTVPGAHDLREILERSVNLVVVATAGRFKRFYSRPYLREMESYLPVRLSFLDRQGKKWERRKLSLGTLLEVLA